MNDFFFSQIIKMFSHEHFLPWNHYETQTKDIVKVNYKNLKEKESLECERNVFIFSLAIPSSDI